jgi:NADPH2:quinone reductase
MTAVGGPEVMKLVEVDVGAPGSGEVLIRQTVVGVNFKDVYHRTGRYALELPSGVGMEAAGVIERCGSGVSDFAPGDRVVYLGGDPGAYATHRVVSAARVVKIPSFVSDEDAAALFSKGTTAEYLLNRCYSVQAGDYVVFMAAAGGVGLVAGQWGRALGAKMIGIAGGPEKCHLAAEHGYAHVIDRKSEDIVARVLQITEGAGVPVVYDSVGKATFDVSLACLAPRGFFVSFGATSGSPPPVDARRLQEHGSLYFTRPSLVHYTAKRAELVASANALFGMMQRGAVKPHIGQRYALADAVQAHRDLEAGRTTGSTILLCQATAAGAARASA